jgi:23S rRNA U2552 (ribose-2'-O)-methylase RlmE/FtsJ
MNDLEKYFESNKKRRIFKWLHYFEIYDSHFRSFRDKKMSILEVGVLHGGSLQMWKDYFGPEARIYGIDINPECKKFEEENIKIFIGSQSDKEFLASVRAQIPQVDILIDDGGHTMEQQIVTFEELFSHIQPNGVYLCEDIHTSYHAEFGGGLRKPGTFIEYSKNFIDSLNAWHSREGALQVNSFTRSVHALHYYSSVLVIEKREMNKPISRKTGKKSF